MASDEGGLMLRNILIGVALTPILLACAPFQRADIQSMPPQQVALVDATCTQVMGLRKGEYYYLLCRESLANTLAAEKEGRDMSAAYKECRQRGLKEGSPAFSTCMLDSGATAPMPQAATTIAYAAGPAAEPGKSFYSIPPRVQFLRERYSCAQLGLLPGSGSFGQCVASLQGAMMPSSD